MINAPIAGEIDIYELHGRIVKSISLTKPGTCFWDTRRVAAGLYLIRLRNETQNLQVKLITR